MSRLAPGSTLTQPQRLAERLLGLEWLERKIDQSPPSSGEINNEWSYSSTLPYADMYKENLWIFEAAKYILQLLQRNAQQWIQYNFCVRVRKSSFHITELQFTSCYVIKQDKIPWFDRLPQSATITPPFHQG
jgi:hypothetical protein